MANEPTFAQQQVTEETLSESDRIRQRIQNYKAQLSPNALSVIEVMLNQQLTSGLIKPGDLDALILLRDDVNKASIDYKTQVDNAQRRLTELAETEAAEKVAVEEAKMQDLVDSRDAERSRRKGVEDRMAQMEAVLASHGISMDLNQDGVIGLKEGQEASELTAEEQEQVDDMIQVDKENITSKPSRAFQMARMLNPESSVSDEQMAAANEIAEQEEVGYDANGSPTTESNIIAPQSETTNTLFADTHAWADNEDKERTEFEDKVEGARQSFAEWNEENSQLELEIPEDAKGTDDFLEEVEKVEQDAKRTDLADGVYLEEREVEEPTPELATMTAPPPSAPVISNSQLPEDEPEFVMTGERVKIIPEIPEEQEEEFEEITIPSESDLKAMTKKTIAEQASVLDFDVPTTLTKPKMIESFLQQTEDFISGLQESGEFVSATSSEDEDDDTDNNQDGGYF